MAFVPPDSLASPSVADDLSVTISEHRWGIWLIDGTPSYDFTSPAFREARWMNNGSDEEDRQQFYSYVVIGFGPYGAIYLSSGSCIVLLVALALFVGFLIQRRRKRKQNKVLDAKT